MYFLHITTIHKQCYFYPWVSLWLLCAELLYHSVLFKYLFVYLFICLRNLIPNLLYWYCSFVWFPWLLLEPVPRCVLVCKHVCIWACCPSILTPYKLVTEDEWCSFLLQYGSNNMNTLYREAFQSIIKDKSESTTLCCLLIIIDHKIVNLKKLKGPLWLKALRGHNKRHYCCSIKASDVESCVIMGCLGGTVDGFLCCFMFLYQCVSFFFTKSVVY